MTTSWTLPTQTIIQDAYEQLNVIGAGEIISPEDNELAYRTFQNILKEMPIHGFVWNKITSVPVALTWSGGAPNQVTMPVDYFGVPSIYFVQNSQNVYLTILTKEQYEEIKQPTATALYPQSIYISPSNVGYLYPVPTADPSLKITYQAIASDAGLLTTPDIKQHFIGGFGTWLAYELMPKFQGISDYVRNEIKERYAIKKKMMLEYSTETAPIRFSVSD